MTDKELREGCDVAAKYQVVSVCIKPYAVPLAREILAGSDAAAGTVVGFPHGNSRVDVKLREIELALADGATEIDAVVNIGDDIANEAVTHVMIGACSRRMKAEAFHFPEVAMARANLREGVLWIVAQMAVVMLAGGKAMNGMFGWNETATIIALAVLAGSYTIYGGLVSVAWTDFLQFVVMSVGLIVVTFLVLHHVGWDTLVATVQTHHGAGGFDLRVQGVEERRAQAGVSHHGCGVGHEGEARRTQTTAGGRRRRVIPPRSPPFPKAAGVVHLLPRRRSISRGSAGSASQAVGHLDRGNRVRIPPERVAQLRT